MGWYQISWFSLLSNKHFQRFYGIYGPLLKTLINNNCTEEYDNYQHFANNVPFANPVNCTKEMISWGWGLRPKDCSGYAITNCILENLPETAKADMQAAGLVLGLMPVILAMTGSSHAETGLLALRRPVLATILGLASPAVNPIRTFEYNDALKVLQRRVGLAGAPGQLAQRRYVQLTVQYVAGIAALINLIMITIQLTRQTINGNDPNRDYQVMVWAMWAFAIHLFGAAALMLRVRLDDASIPASRRRKQSWWKKFFKWLNISKRIEDELTPCGMMANCNLVVRSQGKRMYVFFALAWAVSIATIVHIVYGTLIFSNILFLSGGEALGVLLQCLASVAVCRMVVVWELKEMGRKVKVEVEQIPTATVVTSLEDDTGAVTLQDLSGTKVTVVDTGYTRLKGNQR